MLTVLRFWDGVGSSQTITVYYIGEGGPKKLKKLLRNTWTAPDRKSKFWFFNLTHPLLKVARLFLSHRQVPEYNNYSNTVLLFFYSVCQLGNQSTDHSLFDSKISSSQSKPDYDRSRIVTKMVNLQLAA